MCMAGTLGNILCVHMKLHVKVTWLLAFIHLSPPPLIFVGDSIYSLSLFFVLLLMSQITTLPLVGAVAN